MGTKGINPICVEAIVRLRATKCHTPNVYFEKSAMDLNPHRWRPFGMTGISRKWNCHSYDQQLDAHGVIS